MTQSGGQGQPRWAWWVVGIVIPVVGILITVYVSTVARSDGASAPLRAGGSADRPGAEKRPEPSKGVELKKVFGPGDLALDFRATSGINVELDASEPMVMDSDRGADVLATVPEIGGTLRDVDFLGPLAADVLAPLPASSTAPLGADCERALERNLSERLMDVTVGKRFCVATSEGRVASVQVVSAPTGGTVLKLKVTVWKAP